jgi:hypothetical protein
MDVYCHPFTSGGQEIPIQEAKLTELITLATNYSCGEDVCTEESGGLPLEWAEYREPGTQFIKASTFATSIADQIEKVYKMNLLEKREIEKRARNFVLNRYSAEIIGKTFEDLFDSLPYADYQYKKENIKCNPFFEPNENLNDKEWVESLYENILKDKDENGIQHWIGRLKTDLKRNDVLNYFKRIAFSKNETNETENLLIELKNNPDQKRIAFIQPESNEEVIIASALISSIKKIYPKHKIYFFTKPEYFDLINSNPHIEKILQYNNKMDDPLYFEGKGDQIKYFDIVYAPYLSIRNNFTRNCEDKIQFDIYESN